jgi:hypothetical protein
MIEAKSVIAEPKRVMTGCKSVIAEAKSVMIESKNVMTGAKSSPVQFGKMRIAA